ncbi:flavodoxin family protein [Methanobrevibacter olleyae]|uniref:Multimeric flavodoxin WrbA n=1 Tax=Methanobrevibacter olleyae TaxID=294671 RepID=A0A126R278_METOL|nr:flavodoxin family protein [Methanobrevibacter olleyae]AMK15745.1 NADPH-dependent FMN reductase [Methanobrevibacter olleyae]SFL58548.1 Multimeric flavodoxin WrbA [Methanobrevibacter olleyae]
MDFYIVNGSPRKKYNTAQILEKASGGIFDELRKNYDEEDINIHQIHLYDLDFKGCKSCFHCKRIGGKYYAKCPIKDDLLELLPKIQNADGIIFGSPIYFGELSGELRSFFERFLFSALVYGGESNAPKRMPIGMIYSMNLTEEGCEQFYANKFDVLENTIEILYSKPYSLKVYDTFQFSDYSKYENYAFDPELKAKRRKEHFPIDLEDAYNLGVKIAQESLKI